MIRWDLKAVAEILGYEMDFNKDIFNITTDSRKVDENSLFIAIKGENFDGHDFINQAFLDGAVAVVTEKKVAGLRDTDYCLYVKDTKEALLEIACGYKDFTGIKTVAVTGSVGKTTTKDMVWSVVNKSIKAMRTKENLNNELGVAYTLLEIEKNDKVGVIELGMDRKGDIDYLSRHLEPDIALITWVGKGHLEYLGRVEEVLKEKLFILSGMDRKSPIILNLDNQYLKSVVSSIKNPVISYGIKEKNVDFFAHTIKEDYKKLNTQYILRYKNSDYKITLPTIGLHNVVNSLGALAVGECLGLNIDTSIEGLLDYKPSGMRQNIVRKFNMTFIEDCYNASPDSMEAAIKTLGKMETKGRKIAVLGDMYELGEIEVFEHEELASIFLENNIDFLFLTGSLVKNTYNKLEKLKNKRVWYFKEKKDLTKFLKSFIKEEDTILFKASNGMALKEVLNNIYKEKNGVE